MLSSFSTVTTLCARQPGSCSSLMIAGRGLIGMTRCFRVYLRGQSHRNGSGVSRFSRDRTSGGVFDVTWIGASAASRSSKIAARTEVAPVCWMSGSPDAALTRMDVSVFRFSCSCNLLMDPVIEDLGSRTGWAAPHKDNSGR